MRRATSPYCRIGRKSEQLQRQRIFSHCSCTIAAQTIEALRMSVAPQASEICVRDSTDHRRHSAVTTRSSIASASSPQGHSHLPALKSISMHPSQRRHVTIAASRGCALRQLNGGCVHLVLNTYRPRWAESSKRYAGDGAVVTGGLRLHEESSSKSKSSAGSQMASAIR
jgi:hypothetical protein